MREPRMFIWQFMMDGSSPAQALNKMLNYPEEERKRREIEKLRKENEQLKKLTKKEN